jgi:hypothetical protein
VTGISPAMSTSKNGALGKLNGKIGGRIHKFHCIIHQEVMCCKILTLNNILKQVVSILIFIHAP